MPKLSKLNSSDRCDAMFRYTLVRRPLSFGMLIYLFLWRVKKCPVSSKVLSKYTAISILHIRTLTTTVKTYFRFGSCFVHISATVEVHAIVFLAC